MNQFSINNKKRMTYKEPPPLLLLLNHELQVHFIPREAIPSDACINCVWLNILTKVYHENSHTQKTILPWHVLSFTTFFLEQTLDHFLLLLGTRKHHQIQARFRISSSNSFFRTWVDENSCIKLFIIWHAAYIGAVYNLCYGLFSFQRQPISIWQLSSVKFIARKAKFEAFGFVGIYLIPNNAVRSLISSSIERLLRIVHSYCNR